jgi:hypothetical protein
VTGGGFNLPLVSDPTAKGFVRQSSPDLGGPTGWVVTLDPAAANNFQVNGGTVSAVCVMT